MDINPPSSPPAAGTLQPRRILVRGVNWLGDAVMSTPALQRLRERFPEAHIALLTPERFIDLWRHQAAVSETIGLAPAEGPLSVSRKLSDGCFDHALVLPNSPRAALEVWLARIPRRIGYARPWRNWLLTQTVATRPGHVPMHKRSVAEIRRLIGSPTGPTQRSPLSTHHSPSAHQIHEYLHLFAVALGANPEPLPPQITVPPLELERAGEKFRLVGLTHPIFAINPGAQYGPAKRWPVERFIAAAREIQKRANCLWLILGGAGDTEIAGRIDAGLRAAGSDFRNLAGQTSLRDLCALLKLCRVLLTNDSGPMHVAAALGTPVVVPVGSTSPELTGPGLPGDSRHRLLKSNAPCSPCFRRRCPIDFRCMTGISVEQVVAAILEVSSRGPYR
jgi:heptosyltransferase-2